MEELDLRGKTVAELQEMEDDLKVMITRVRERQGFLNRRDVRQKIAGGVALAMVVVGLAYQFLS